MSNIAHAYVSSYTNAQKAHPKLAIALYKVQVYRQVRDLREFVNLEKTFLRARVIDVKQNAAFEVFF